MNNIRVDIRLRPIRFGFLVRPDDAESVLEIFRINTCLWGGMFNPIIPFFECVPSWWEREDHRFENANQIINGYLDFFEPDYLVEAERGLADGFGFDPNRVLQLPNILEREGKRGWDGYGLNVIDLYKDLYAKEFQFEKRHKHKVVHLGPMDSAFDNFVACNFGSFPIREEFLYFESNYKDVFNPCHIRLDAAAFSDLYESNFISPIEISCKELGKGYHERRLGVLFILDAKESKDLVDFWNLRAIHERIHAVPIQWIEALSLFCKKLIRKRYDFIFSRSICEDRGKEIRENYLSVSEEQFWIPGRYPPIWRKPSSGEFRTSRPTLASTGVNSGTLEVQIDSDNPEIRFDPLLPKFAVEYGNQPRVVNVIRLRDWSNTGQIATVFPCNYKTSTFPKFGLSFGFPLSTTEGFVIFPKYRDLSRRWKLNDGTTAFNQWFKNNQVSATPSDAGRATEQIIQTLGGFEDVGCLAHEGVIRLLNKISRRPVTKTDVYETFRGQINCAVNSEKLGNSIFETLVNRKVVELGLELKCSKCGSWSWYSVRQLDYLLTCSFCFKQVDFPVINPLNSRHSRWAYRVIGPFAQPDYAKGGYAAALAVRFFANVIDDNGSTAVTWSSGHELELPTGKKVEADFILWHQHREFFGLDYLTDTVFGEAKSFRKFDEKDVDKMEMLAKEFPGSILVFATMREGTAFSKSEINRIKKLAKWGRKYDPERRQTRAPVIVLTGTELFAEYSLKDSWEKKGGKHKEMIEHTRERIDNLRVLADLTQQLYLGMPPYPSTNSVGETTWFNVWRSVSGTHNV